jgi:signal transduction histidine kinase
MKKISTLLATGLITLSMTTMAAEMGTPDEAKAMSESAAALINTTGDAAFAEFSKEGGNFLTKDLYVFCMDMEGKMLSHAVKPQLVGKNLIAFNKYGETLFANMIEAAKGGSGWVNYSWPKPDSEDITQKTSYVIKNDKGFFCGVGAYKS